MIKIYDFLLTIATPLIKLFGKIHMPFSKKRITGNNYFMWRDKISIGTVLLTKTRGELSNLINPTYLKHAGIYVGSLGDSEIKYVLEATSKGVVLTDLVSFLTSKDVVVGCKPSFIGKGRRNEFEAEIKEAALRFKGIPYDYLFKRTGKAFYCFELCAATLNQAFPELNLKVREIVKDKRIYDENTFLDKKFFKVIFDSRKLK